MHLIIPFASSSSEGCVAAKPKLQLPHLQKLLGRLCLVARDSGDELSLSPPHERALARTLGLAAPDGQIAWAAWQASQRPELARLGGAWCFVSLCHWQVNTHTMVMSHLPLPDLSVRESADLLAAMRPYFEEDGIALHEDHDQPGRWLAQGEIFATLASASPDRASRLRQDTLQPMGDTGQGYRGAILAHLCGRVFAPPINFYPLLKNPVTQHDEDSSLRLHLARRSTGSRHFLFD